MDPKELLAELANKASDLTARAAKLKDSDAAAIAFEAIGLTRDAKESLATTIAKIDAKSALQLVLPFLPPQYQAIGKIVLTVAGLLGAGWGAREYVDTTNPPAAPAVVNVELPAEETARLEKLAAELKAAQEKAAEIMREANKPRKLVGKDASGKVVTEIGF